MKSKDTLVIDLTVNWRMLVFLGAVVLLSILAYSGVIAQNGNPPSTNDAAMAPIADEPQAVVVTVPNSPEGQDGNLVYTTNGEWVPRDSIGATSMSSLNSAEIQTTSGGMRHVYLTKNSYNTNQVRTACASGYHTASLWELYDVSNLIYDYSHPAAYTKADSGYGPPAYWYGWVRTGYDSSSSSTIGTGNCTNWTSTSNTVYGVSVRLSRTWETAPGDIGPWDATSLTCDYTGPVWCVGNFSTVYLPLILRNF